MAGTIISASGLSHNTARINANGINNVFTINHNLGNESLSVQVWDEDSGEKIIVDISITSADTIDVTFAVVPADDRNFIVHMIGLTGQFV